MLIGIYSPAAGSGKSTIADYLVAQHGFTRLGFAEPLKDMIRMLLENYGYNPADAYHMTHVNKHAPLPEIDPRIDARHLLRTLGTEWGRTCVHPDIWLRCWSARYLKLRARGLNNVVVDDMRFLNEATHIDRYGGQLWCVNRPGTERGTTHASEGGLDDLDSDPFLSFTQVLHNDKTLADLYSALDTILGAAPTATPTI
jgi:hypothetical protein